MEPSLPGGHDEFRAIGAPVLTEDAGRRADSYMAENFPFWSRAAWQKAFRSGRVLVDKRPIRSSHRLKPGDRLYIYYPHEVEPEVDDGIAVLWEEAGVMAVYKPSGLPMHENGPYRKNTFARLLIDKVGRDWAAVHRLDRETSGIVICAADPDLRAA